MPRAHGEGQRRQRIVSEMREVEKKGRTMGWGFETCALLMIWKNRNSAEGLGGDGLDWGWVAATWDHYSCRVVPFAHYVLWLYYNASGSNLLNGDTQSQVMPSHTHTLQLSSGSFTNRPIPGM